MPVPLDYREQVPDDLPHRCDSSREVENHAASLRRQARQLCGRGNPRPPTKDEAIEVRWSAIVLCGPRSFSDVPKAVTIPSEWPRETHEWLRTRPASIFRPTHSEGREGNPRELQGCDGDHRRDSQEGGAHSLPSERRVHRLRRLSPCIKKGHVRVTQISSRPCSAPIASLHRIVSGYPIGAMRYTPTTSSKPTSRITGGTPLNQHYCNVRGLHRGSFRWQSCRRIMRKRAS